MRPAIAQFNSVASYKRLHAVLCLMLEEIVMLVEGGVGDGLQAKACAAIPLWGEWQEWNRVHRNAAQLLHNNPRALETELVLKAAASGYEPCEILRQVIELRQKLPAAPNTSTLENFNDFAEFKAMATEMWLRIEDVCMAIDSDQAEGLWDKCSAAIQFWELFKEWLDAHGDGKEPNSDPLRLQIDLLLNLGILDWQPAEIRRRLQQLRDENGWTEVSPIDAAKLRAAEAAACVWRN